MEQSVTSYIIKPIDIELLLSGIEKASIKIENERLKYKLQKINQELEDKVALKTKELLEKNEKLEKQLFIDELTSLYNRKALIKDIKNMQNPILSVIDIDAFKSINDLYGEHIGNEVLENVSRVLLNHAKNTNCIAYRIGSDEFALLKDEVFIFDKSESMVECIIKAINDSIIFLPDYKISIRIDVTIGVSKEKEETVEKANMALKRAKRKKYPYLIYCEKHNLNEEYMNDIKWTKIIENAIVNDKIVAYYQPIVNANQDIIKYECLMRIVEEDSVHSPILFLDIAKKVKFYPQLTRIILTKAFEKAHSSRVDISVNLSIEDISNAETIDFINEQLKKYSVSNFIIFEILESENITDYEKIITFIEHVQSLGCRIAIDDFGSGYSNFAYLLKLKPNYIKIDGSSVKNINKDKNSFLITKTINSFAHSLGIKTIAEFVHSKEVFDIVKEIGVDEFQGYYFSAPKEELYI
ncbi:MAG: GGDEF and EAL domain-containing protein [Campylobacterota bacterium]|nr:GGDEF and EAL domain-containing protein [Campylobacterota bacterium]